MRVPLVWPMALTLFMSATFPPLLVLLLPLLGLSWLLSWRPPARPEPWDQWWEAHWRDFLG